MQRATRHSVLLVEANPSLRRMITLGLQHRGLQVIEADAPASFPVPPTILPDLIVLDIDGEMANGQTLLAQAEAHPALSTLPIVALTWEGDFPLAMREGDMRGSAPARMYLTKPFDARIMQESIKQLLAVRAAKEAALLAQTEAVLLATYKTQTPPSIWPIITAIGLLIAFMGMLLQVVVTILGILIVIIALLWWTLGTKPTARAVALGCLNHQKTNTYGAEAMLPRRTFLSSYS